MIETSRISTSSSDALDPGDLDTRPTGPDHEACGPSSRPWRAHLAPAFVQPSNSACLNHCRHRQRHPISCRPAGSDDLLCRARKVRSMKASPNMKLPMSISTMCRRPKTRIMAQIPADRRGLPLVAPAADGGGLPDESSSIPPSGSIRLALVKFRHAEGRRGQWPKIRRADPSL